MNKEYAVGSINKIGKIGYIIAKICRIFIMIGAIGSLVGAIIMLAVPDDLFEIRTSGNGFVQLKAEGAKYADMEITESVLEEFNVDLNNEKYAAGEVKFSPDHKYIIADITGGDKFVNPNRIAFMLFSVVVYLAATLVVVIFVEKLCKEFRDSDSPFTDRIVTALERFAWSIIPWAFIHTTFSGFIQNAFSRDMDLHLGFSLSMVLAVLLIFGIAKIFKYGAVLQKESDETL